MNYTLPKNFPENGLGDEVAFELISRIVRDKSANLGSTVSFAHMDPPPPKVAIETTRLNAQCNQNLLHPDLSPFATEAESIVIDWIADAFQMRNGHMCAGSTIANLTALWAAREHGAKSIVCSADAHLSVAKSAHILGLPCKKVATDKNGKMDVQALPDLSNAALVLTAGTTGRGAIDPLSGSHLEASKWVHVDAAWAGPLRLSRYRALLDGIESADSVAISAHKWLFQPKDSAICLFKAAESERSVSFSGSYLATPNVGVQGSRGAAGITLLATFLAMGQAGLDQKLHQCIKVAEQVAIGLDEFETTELCCMPQTGVFNWRPVFGVTEQLVQDLKGVSSTVMIEGQPWMRNVAANPHADAKKILNRIKTIVSRL